MSCAAVAPAVQVVKEITVRPFGGGKADAEEDRTPQCRAPSPNSSCIIINKDAHGTAQVLLCIVLLDAIR